MSKKNQFNQRFWEVEQRISQLEQAKMACVPYSEQYWLFDAQIIDNRRILISCNKATMQSYDMKYTAGGDFTHLGSVGSVSFRKVGAHV